MSQRTYASFNSAYEVGINPKMVYESRPSSKRPDCSDLFSIDTQQLIHEDVPNELLDEQVFEGNYILELGREISVKVPIVGGKVHTVTLGKGTMLLKKAVREEYPQYLCWVDNSLPEIWLGKNSADKHYQSFEDRTINIIRMR